MDFVQTTEQGKARVLNGRAGLVLPVELIQGSVAHVRDHRYGSEKRPQVWSLGEGDWEPVRIAEALKMAQGFETLARQYHSDRQVGMANLIRSLSADLGWASLATLYWCVVQ